MADDRDQDDEQSAPPRGAGDGVRMVGAQEAGSTRSGSGAVVPPEAQGRSTAATEMPHWTEPPTGEVPQILPDSGDGRDSSSQGSSPPVWRGEQRADWDKPDFDANLLGTGDEAPTGALDMNRGDRSDLFSFDEPGDDDSTAETPRSHTRRLRGRTAKSEESDEGLGANPRSERNLPIAIATGLVAAAVALACFRLGPGWSAALVTVVVTLCAAEAFAMLRRAGFRPATLLGLVATVALMAGAYLRGERAVPLILALAVMCSMLWYLFGVVRARPAQNIGATLLALLWVGFLGSFASLLLRYPGRQGIAFLLGAVLVAVANDIGALFVGRSLGRTPLAPEISPNKTIEGFIGGLALSLIVGLMLGLLHPWEMGSGLILGLVVSVIAPAGDLCQSLIKRDIGIKDTSTLFPGHGGVLDRFDGLLFVLPAVYYLVELLDLATLPGT